MELPLEDIHALLENKVKQFNRPDFIQDDPISIPHRFTKKQDIEIIAFIVSLIAWGKRAMIIKNGEHLIQLMGDSPHEYILQYKPHLLDGKRFVHRTFNTTDLHFIFTGLHACYQQYDSLEELFIPPITHPSIKARIINMRNFFLQFPHEKRSEKHLANPEKGSAAKRINMFLRWMVRKDENGVDFGIWNRISMADLCVPLDVHTGNVARGLGIIQRKQNNWKAVEELMQFLRKMDPSDPSKYDFALFGLGVTGELDG